MIRRYLDILERLGYGIEMLWADKINLWLGLKFFIHDRWHKKFIKCGSSATMLEKVSIEHVFVSKEPADDIRGIA